MDPGDGFLSPPSAPQAAVSLPVLDLNGPSVQPSAGLTVAAPPKDENDQGNIFKSTNATAMNGLAPEPFNLSPEQTLNAPAGATGLPKPHPVPSMKAVTILNGANNASSDPRALQPVTDTANIVSGDAKALISPPAAFTPGAHATPANPVVDPLASPLRPAANRVTPLPSPIPPPSAGKQELNDAAMALTWLAEALTGPGAVSPLVGPSPAAAAAYLNTTDRRRKPANAATPYTATAGMQTNNALYTTPYGAGLAGAPLRTTSGSLRGRRAASQRCTTVVQEAILNDRLLNCNPRSLQDGYEPTPRTTTTTTTGTTKRTGTRNSEAALAASAERKLKGYSENSRVGRAMISILEYIEIHQPEYHGVTPFGGVPERIIRQEFGNNPDTSKALRFLVSEKKIVRKGIGGRRDPFNYVLSNGPAAPLAVDGAAGAGETAVAIAVAAAGGDGRLDSSIYVEQKEEETRVAAATGVAGIPLVAPATVVGPSLTPAAAAATLTAPSTGKWPSTVARVAVDPTLKGRKPSQPRLSLGMADPVALEEGRAAAARDTSAKQAVGGGGVIGVKRPANIAYTPKNVSFQGEHVAKRPAQQQQWTGPWPTQLPTGQRLTSLASPPPLSTTTAPPAAGALPTTLPTNPVFLLPPGTSAGTMLNASQQQQQAAAAQAYLLQLKAAQMIWNQQLLAVQRAQQQGQQQQQYTAATAAAAAVGQAPPAAATATLVSPEGQQVLAVPTQPVPVPAAGTQA